MTGILLWLIFWLLVCRLWWEWERKKLMSPKLKMAAVLALWLALACAGWLAGPSLGYGVRLVAVAFAQDPPPPDDEPGNPEHKIPEHPCSHAPKGKRVACKCARHRTCDADGSVIESFVCKSYCHPRFCECPLPPCH